MIFHNLLRSASLALLVVGFAAASSSAAIVTTTLNLVPATSSDNTLTLDLQNSGSSLGSTTTELSGTIDLELDVNLAGEISRFRITDGAFTATDWVLNSGVGSLSGADTGGIFYTEPEWSDVTGEEFTASEHGLVINTGTVTGLGTRDFSNSPLEAPGVGQGSLVATAGGGVNEYDLVLSWDTDFLELIDGGPLGLNVSGTITAAGSFTAVPEPSSLAVLTVLGVTGAVTGRRRARRRLRAAT